MFNSYKIAKLARGLIYSSLLFIPLLIVPSTIWEYVFVRNLIFYCLATAILFLSAVYVYKNKSNIEFFVTRFFFSLVIVLILRIVSGFFGVDLHNSFFGSEARMDGDLGYIMLFGWFLGAMLFLDGEERWHKAFKFSAIAAIFVAVFALIQAFFPANNSFIAGKSAGTNFLSYRLFGTLGNPIFLAGYLLPHIFVCLYLFLRETIKKCKYFWLGVSLFLMTIVFLTHTRGAMISLAISLLIVAAVAGIHFLKSNKKLFKKAFFWGLPFLIVLGVITKLALWTDIKSIFSIAGTASTRFIFWKIGLFGFLDKWLFGWGSENYSYIFSKFYDPQLLKYSFYETWADKPHNQFVEILSTTGILGFAAFVILIILALRALWRLSRLSFAKQNLGGFLPYLCIGGAILSYFGHIFFAFDTLELRMIIFLLFGFIIFSETRYLQNGRKMNQGLLKKFFILLSLISVFSLAIIGAGTLQAAYYTNCAHNSIINNEYSGTVAYFNKLKGIKTPYANGNWEFLSDSVLKADAVGRIPQTVRKEILPIVIAGLEKAAGSNANNFSYHFRLGQMYNLAGTYLNPAYLDKSIAELAKAKEISPKRQVTDLTLAQVYYAKKDVAIGVKILEDLVKENENISLDLYWYLGIFYDAAGQYDKSYAYMSTAVDKKRAFISQDERILYVNVLGRQKDYARMAPAYEEIIKYDKNNPQWWASLATVYLELKRYDDARNAARQAIFLSPQFGDEGENFLKKIDEKEYGK